jgi:two-component system response regulator DegU
MMKQPIRILIADSDTTFTQQLKYVLDQQADLQVIDVVRDGQGAVNGCKELQPHLVLMDLHLPVVDSIKAIQQIVTHNERIKILTTSAIPNDRYAVEAIKVGASGYVEKHTQQAIVETIRQVAGGDVSLNPALAISILEEFDRLAHD